MDPSVLGLWLFPTNSPVQPITKQEEKWANQLAPKRAKEYKHARGCTRQALSDLLDIPPLRIPLNAAPGKPPTLAKGLGYISLSHCNDALLLGWSQSPIGVDIEKKDRPFSVHPLINRFFSIKDKQTLKNLHGEQLRSATLKLWVVKEAAIKWQQGKLSKNLREWNWELTSSYAMHNSLEYKVKMIQIDLDSWIIAIACHKNKYPNEPKICISS